MKPRRKNYKKVSPITIEKYLRKELSINGWSRRGDKCYITEKTRHLEVHHSGLSHKEIVKMAHKQTGISYKPYMQSYSMVDLVILKNKYIELHNMYCEAITLEAKVHCELHKIYGSTVSKKQLEAFKANYNNKNNKKERAA